MKTLNGAKPQDILLLLKIITLNDESWRSIDLARALKISPAEISIGLERCLASGFLDISKRKLMKSALLEFLIHGLKYVFPAQPGHICRGIPTAHSAPPLVHKIVFDQHDQYVWPFDEGELRGQAILPLYETVPYVVKQDAKLYELLALIDALRVGRVREQNLAMKELIKRLS